MEIIIGSVKHLDIRRNSLTKIPQTITKGNNVSELWISDNPYECNCNVVWMKDWLIDNKQVKEQENVTCSGSKLKGKINHIYDPPTSPNNRHQDGTCSQTGKSTFVCVLKWVNVLSRYSFLGGD